jgi:SEC-C motif
MSRKRISRNAPCPCGSGKKYKHCCYHRGFEWQEDEQGDIYKSIPMSSEVSEILGRQKQKFIDKYGREPGPDDPVFFDMPPLEHIEHEMVQAMQAAGLDPAFIYAFEKTGLLVSEQNQHLISDQDLAQWQAALDEYQAKQDGTSAPVSYPIGTIAFYGPDDKTTTKVCAAVIVREDTEPVLKRWVGTDVATSPKVQKELQEFFQQHGVQAVAMSEGNMGCPHEEGEDFPVGEDCPFCPFWRGKQGSNRQQ